MRRIVFVMSMLLAVAPVLWADDPPKEPPKIKAKDAAKPETKPATPAEQFRALAQEYDKAIQGFFKEYQKAKTQAERNKLVQEKYPQPQKYAGKMMDLAEKNPKDPAAVDALVWVVTRVGFGPEANKAIDRLVKDHIDSPKLGAVAASLVYSGSPNAEKLLRTILEKNTHKDVQALACLSLGQMLKRQAERQGASKANREKHEKEAEQLFDRVIKDFADVKYGRGSLADTAKGELFEMRNLGIGKKAPEISGEDTEGKPFKLSDYQGKVVVLDFWGHW
jgi:hypothetical protein